MLTMLRFVSGSLASGKAAVAAGHTQAAHLAEKMAAVEGKWVQLREEVARRRRTLESATEAFQFFSDCNETESVMKEFITLAKSKDFGQDKLTALSLLARHKHLQDKVG